jgi:methylenetetrahydrofolate reductase (NADPH)
LQISAEAAFSNAESSLANQMLFSHRTSGEVGKGELNQASTWDEFPNGRFGDIKSPAYGSGVDMWTSGIAKVSNTIACEPKW